MKKATQTLLFKAFPFLRKEQVKKSPRNYNALVESFKARVQVE